VAQKNQPWAFIRKPTHRDICSRTDPDEQGSMGSDPIQELVDLIQADRLPRVLTGPRQNVDENGSDWIGHFAQIKVTFRNAALETWHFLKNWFNSWLRVVLTGCATGGIIGFAWRLMILPN